MEDLAMERRENWLGYLAVGLGALALMMAFMGRGGPQVAISIPAGGLGSVEVPQAGVVPAVPPLPAMPAQPPELRAAPEAPFAPGRRTFEHREWHFRGHADPAMGW